MNHFLEDTPSDSRGPAARLFGYLGLSWRVTPLRRILQSIFLLTYLYMLLYVSWTHTAVFSNDAFFERELIPAELFLLFDPLVGISSAIAARVFGVVLLWSAGALVVGAVVPRGFCAYVCPLGTMIDIADRATVLVRGKKRRSLPRGLTNVRFYVLAFVIVAAIAGVMFAGHVSAMPLLNRGLVLGIGSVQLGLMKYWDIVTPLTVSVVTAVALLAVVLLLGVVAPRFWCSCFCPTGAMLSLPALLRITERSVGDSCVSCGKCRKACSFDAVEDDYSTRISSCTSCQTCGGVCKPGAISFGRRTKREGEARPNVLNAAPLSRRAFVATGVAAAATGVTMRAALASAGSGGDRLLRPPGSVADPAFSDLCVRCGQCIRVCPGPTLHPATLDASIETLWTPVVVPVRAGCHHECSLCTQVCPTGAIRKLDIAEKRATRMGVARINTLSCLPHTGAEDCDHCLKTCESAGYNAIEMRTIELEIGEIPEGTFSELEIEAMSRIDAPFIVEDKCVGCGQCENRCHTANVRQLKKLRSSAVTTHPLR